MIQAMYDGRFVIVVTMAILDEYTDVLRRPIFATKYGIGPFEVAGFVEFIDDNAVILTDIVSSPIIVRDDMDQKFLDAAHTANAAFLVTGDNDLLELVGDPRLGSLRIVTARQFLDTIDRA